MQNNQPQKEEDKDAIAPDLKHDTMDFSPASEGDALDLDNTTDDEDAISAEELEFLDEDSEESQAAALNEVETDRLADTEDFLETAEGSQEDDWEANDKNYEGKDTEDERTDA
ncbi:MAG: hypothetical protein JWQ27_1346 [Ferruginibacter sp.]|nr:hypothetical protein [Ferruginibacter sp.]